MSLILRVDVDKPYGRKTIARKIASKLTEDFWFPSFLAAKTYLYHLKDFLRFCNNSGVRGHIYHRLCTLPDNATVELLRQGNHKLGFHAENTRNYETFYNELSEFRKRAPLPVESFTKHGSGELKLGKHHYAPYEPEKYKEWSLQSGVCFYFGNEICKNADELLHINGFYPAMFWIEPEYRSKGFADVNQVLDVAKKNDVVILIHPCNYDASELVANEFKTLVALAKNKGIEWKVL